MPYQLLLVIGHQGICRTILYEFLEVADVIWYDCTESQLVQSLVQHIYTHLVLDMYVKFIVIILGTPTLSSSRLGSPVMTVHTEKIHLLAHQITTQMTFSTLQPSTNHLDGTTQFLQSLCFSNSVIVSICCDIELE